MQCKIYLKKLKNSPVPFTKPEFRQCSLDVVVGVNRRRLWKGTMGDTGFEPVTPTVCRKDGPKGEPEK